MSLLDQKSWKCVSTVLHMPALNLQIEDELTEEQLEVITDYGLNDLADRQQLSVAGLWKRVQGDRAACKRHSKIGCSGCFDFKKQLLQQLLPGGAAAAAAGSSSSWQQQQLAAAAVRLNLLRQQQGKTLQQQTTAE
jgi:hypothetical protein